MMCVLESNQRSITSDNVVILSNFISGLSKESRRINKIYTGGSFIGELNTPAEYYSTNYFWFITRYTPESYSYHKKATQFYIKKSLYWKEWSEIRPHSQITLSHYRLQEVLWDQEKEEIRYHKLADFIESYPWAFPLNVVELHKESVAKEAAKTKKEGEAK